MPAAVLAFLLLGLLPGRAPAEVRAGADLSYLPRMQALGVEYRLDGEPVDPLALLHQSGCTMVRLRLWHTPAEPWHGIDSVLAFAARVRAAGFDWMLDIHYSDTWADPGDQSKPAAWAGLELPELGDSVYTYTHSVINRCRSAGCLPDHVQIGNEINAGFLWDEGRVGWPGSQYDTPEQWEQFTRLLTAGIDGVRDALQPGDDLRIVIHSALGGDRESCRWFFDGLLAGGVEFDVIGLSFYPWWHGSLTDLAWNLHQLAARYGREIQIVETSYPWTLDGYDGTGNFVTEESQLVPGYPASPDGQLRFLQDLASIVRGVPNDPGGAVLYWEPAFLAVEGGPANPHENLTLYDFDGDALPGVGFPSAPAGSAHQMIQIVGDFNGWDATGPGMSRQGAFLWADTVQVEAGCHLFKFLTDASWDLPLDYGSCSGEDPGCAVPAHGPVCPVAFPGTALGRIEFPLTGAYLFRLDEWSRSYEIIPLDPASGTGEESGPWSPGLAVSPSPFLDSTIVTMRFGEPTSVSLAVYSAEGRLVRGLFTGPVASGAHEVRWDGADSHGRPAPPGIYLIRLSGPWGEVARKVIRAR